MDTHTKKHTYTENITAQIKSTSLAVVVVVFVFVAFTVVVFLLFPLSRCTGRGDESPPDILTTEPARKLEVEGSSPGSSPASFVSKQIYFF